MVDSNSLISEPAISLALDANDVKVDFSPDSIFFSESPFISNSLDLEEDSVGFDIDVNFEFSNDCCLLIEIPEFHLDSEIVEFELPFVSDSDTVEVPEIF